MRNDFGRYAMLMGAEASGRLIAFLLTSIVARSLGLEVLAFVSLAQGLVAYVTVVSDGGLNNHAVRLLLKGGNVETVVAQTIRAQVALVVVASIVVGAFVVLTVPQAIPYFALLVGVPIATALSTPYVLQAQHRTGPVALSRVVGSIATVVAGLGIIIAGLPDFWIASAYSVGAIAMFVVVFRACGASRAWYFSRARLLASLVVVRETAPLAGSALMVQVLASLPLLLTQAGDDLQSFEAMGVASRLWFLASAPAAMVGAVLIPLLADPARRVGVFPRFLAVFSILGAVASGTLLVFAEPINTLLFGADAAVYSPESAVFSLGLFPFYIGAILTCRAISAGVYSLPFFANGVGVVVLLLGLALLDNVGATLAVSWAWVCAQVLTTVVLTIGQWSSKFHQFASGGR